MSGLASIADVTHPPSRIVAPLRLGGIVLWRMTNGNIWFEAESGEGMEVRDDSPAAEELRALVDRLFRENF